MITMLDCPMCGKLTLHQENKVPDLESATVWCCLDCGHERRPSEPGGNTDPVELKPKPPSGSGGVKLPKIKDKELVDAK